MVLIRSPPRDLFNYAVKVAIDTLKKKRTFVPLEKKRFSFHMVHRCPPHDACGARGRRPFWRARSPHSESPPVRLPDVVSFQHCRGKVRNGHCARCLLYRTCMYLTLLRPRRNEANGVFEVEWPQGISARKW